MDRAERRQVYSDQQKLRLLLNKVKADFLGNQKAAIEVELAKVPPNISYEVSLTMFRNAVTARLRLIARPFLC